VHESQSARKDNSLQSVESLNVPHAVNNKRSTWNPFNLGYDFSAELIDVVNDESSTNSLKILPAEILAPCERYPTYVVSKADAWPIQSLRHRCGQRTFATGDPTGKRDDDS
jgi:hypothetical protein